jgi:nicotinamidase-related amidase
MDTAPSPTVLLLVDLQNDYFPGGRRELAGAGAAAAQAARLLEAFRARGAPVVHVRHESLRAGATYLLPGTPGAELHPLVAPRPGEPVVTKHRVNAYQDTPLLETLRGLGARRLVVAGMQTHMCIDSGVRASADLGFECLVAHDACATRDLPFRGELVPAAQVHAAYLAGLDGLFAKVLGTDEVIAGA